MVHSVLTVGVFPAGRSISVWSRTFTSYMWEEKTSPDSSETLLKFMCEKKAKHLDFHTKAAGLLQRCGRRDQNHWIYVDRCNRNRKYQFWTEVTFVHSFCELHCGPLSHGCWGDFICGKTWDTNMSLCHSQEDPPCVLVSGSSEMQLCSFHPVFPPHLILFWNLGV